jgi:hypothetical protein
MVRCANVLRVPTNTLCAVKVAVVVIVEVLWDVWNAVP